MRSTLRMIRSWRFAFYTCAFMIAGYCSSYMSLVACEAQARKSLPHEAHVSGVSGKILFPWIVTVNRSWSEGNFCGTDCGWPTHYLCLFGLAVAI